jgi:hypothetical protein
MRERREICCLSPKACRGRESRRSREIAVVAEDEEVEGELGLQILRALSILKFLEEFLVVFMVFLLQSPICLCCNRGVGGKVEKLVVFGVLDCEGGRFLWSGGCEMDGVVVGEPGPLLLWTFGGVFAAE